MLKFMLKKIGDIGSTSHYMRLNTFNFKIKYILSNFLLYYIPNFSYNQLYFFNIILFIIIKIHYFPYKIGEASIIEDFLKDIDRLPLSWSNFSDFNKLNKITDYELEIKSLNELLGEKEENINEKLIEIVKNNPKTIDILLLLIAIRPLKLKNTNIYSPYSSGETLKKLYEGNLNELIYFFENSGLRALFISKFVNNLNDYLKGIEIGLDSNSRKNRNGTVMELKCEEIIDKWCKKHNLTYYKQENLKRFKKDTLIDKKFDFLIVLEDKYIAIEVNNYNSTGSKIKSISEEYIKLNNSLKEENISFVWVTNGVSWIQNKKQLSRNLLNIENFINLKMLEDNYLDKLILKNLTLK